MALSGPGMLGAAVGGGRLPLLSGEPEGLVFFEFLVAVVVAPAAVEEAVVAVVAAVGLAEVLVHHRE